MAINTREYPGFFSPKVGGYPFKTGTRPVASLLYTSYLTCTVHAPQVRVTPLLYTWYLVCTKNVSEDWLSVGADIIDRRHFIM